MNIEINEKVIVSVSILPRKNKVNDKLYYLYMLFNIKENGLKPFSTEFSIGQTLAIKDWDIIKKMVKENSARANNLNDSLTGYDNVVKKYLNLISIKEVNPTAAIIRMIKTSIKIAITGKEARGEKPIYEEKLTTHTIDSVMESLFKFKKQSEERKRIYKHAVGIFHQFFNNKTPDITNISEFDLMAFQGWFRENYKMKSGPNKGKPPKQNSCTTWFSMIAAIFLHAVKRMKIIPISPLPEKFRGAFKDAKRNVLSSSDCMRIIQLEDDLLTRTQLIGKYCLLFQFLTGIGYGDMLSLSLEHLKFDEEVSQWYIQKCRNKTGVEFIVFLSQRAKYAFDKLRELTPGVQYALTLPTIDYSNRIYNVISNKSKIKIRISTYTLRHTYAVNFMELDGRIEDLQKILGHEGLRTTQIYGKINHKRLNQVTRNLESKSEMHRLPKGI